MERKKLSHCRFEFWASAVLNLRATRRLELRLTPKYSILVFSEITYRLLGGKTSHLL